MTLSSAPQTHGNSKIFALVEPYELKHGAAELDPRASGEGILGQLPSHHASSQSDSTTSDGALSYTTGSMSDSQEGGWDISHVAYILPRNIFWTSRALAVARMALHSSVSIEDECEPQTPPITLTEHMMILCSERHHRPGRAAVLVHYNTSNHQGRQQLATEQAVDAMNTAAAGPRFDPSHSRVTQANQDSCSAERGSSTRKVHTVQQNENFDDNTVKSCAETITPSKRSRAASLPGDAPASFDSETKGVQLELLELMDITRSPVCDRRRPVSDSRRVCLYDSDGEHNTSAATP